MTIEFGVFVVLMLAMLGWMRLDISKQGKRLEEKIEQQGARLDAEIAKLRQEMVEQGDRMEEKIDRLRQEMSEQGMED